MITPMALTEPLALVRDWRTDDRWRMRV